MADHTARGSRSLALNPDEERVVRAVLEALRRIRHGSVQVVVQDGTVVQIDTVEKTRLSK
ncbi:MAG TPA: YezD family protein [Chloroflexota bacterium]|nr:YezD family protein [Chloroflexota bacterium]